MKTIASVKPNVREYSNSYGPQKAIDGTFQDGDGWSISCKPGNEERVKADLESKIGKPLEGYTAEPAMDKTTGQQRQFNGKPQWTLKAQMQGGGGYRGGRPESYSYSREAHEITQRSIQRACALERAIQFAVAFNGPNAAESKPEAIIDIANKFFDWLSIPAPAKHERPKDEYYKQFVSWLADKVKAGVLQREPSWKAAMTFANQLGYNNETLQTCVDSSVFQTIKDKLIAPTHPRNGNVVKQPLGVDDDFPF